MTALAGRRVPLGPIAAGVVVMLLSAFPPGWAALSPAPGLESAWSAGLDMAVRQDLAFGRDVVFTYGPLGFLKVPILWYRDHFTLGVVYRAGTLVAMGAVLFAGLRRSFGAIGALLVAIVVASTASDVMPVVVFLWAAWLLIDVTDDTDAVRRFALGAGALGAFELLAKLNTGVSMLAIAAVALVFLPGRTANLAWFAVAATTVFLALWTVAGQPWSALPDYAHNGARIISGYSAAMDTEEPDRAWEYGAALVVFIAGALAAMEGGGGALVDRRPGLIVVWSVLAFLSFKSGFVRHDGHSLNYFSTLLAGLCAFRWRPGRRSLGVAVMALAFVACLGSARMRLTDLIEPVPRLGMALDVLRTTLDPDRQARFAAQGRADIERDAALRPGMLAALRGHTVHVAPWDTAVAWAYRLAWRPLPVFQSYTAYTSGLDRLDAAMLASPQGPERILLHAGLSIDGRYGPLDEPLAMRTMLCRYVPVQASAPWVVLAHGPDRCGVPRLVASLRVGWGQAVAVPAPSRPGALVYLVVAGALPSRWERVRTLLYKGNDRSITFDGRDPQRLIAAVASDGMVLRSGPGIDFPVARQIPQATTVGVGRAGLDEHAARRGTQLRFDFYEQPVAPGRH